MSPLVVSGLCVGALALGAVLGFLLASARHQRRLEQLAGEQQNSVGLYLRRKVAEAGIDPGELGASRGPEASLGSNVVLATSLLDRERHQIELGDTQELGLARTMRLKSTSENLIQEE